MRTLSIILPAVFLAAAMLTACETPPPVDKLPELTYAHLGPLRFNAGAMQVTTVYRPPMKAPNVDHLLPMPPLKTLRQWAGDRLFVDGSKGLLRFTITNAAVTETALKIKKGLKGAFHKEQSERYDAVIEVSIEILDDRGFRLGFASARTNRSMTVREDATLNKRRHVQFELIEALMNDFNAEIERNIRQHLGKWLL